MKRETIRELLVLRLYGELEPAESEALERALAEDEESRAFAAELARGLGRALHEREPASAAEPFDREWTEQLKRSVNSDEPARMPAHSRKPHWLLFAAAAGFLVGVILSPFAGDDPSADPLPAAVAVDLSNTKIAGAGSFTRDVPPPRATGSGPLQRIGLLLER